MPRNRGDPGWRANEAGHGRGETSVRTRFLQPRLPDRCFRGRMRGHAAEQMHVAVDILTPTSDPCSKCGEPRKPSNADALKALDLLCRYGIGVKFEKFSPDLVRALALAVQAEEHDKDILRRIEARWALVLREHVTGEPA